MTLSRLKLRSFFSGLFLFFAVFLACEGMARIAFAWKLPHFEHVRLMVTGKLPPDAAFQNSIGQAYLLYIPAPK
ncbi:MAG TPA: hypothetical protein VD913_06685, partial [bacterium]|nr:hypothetical protein [bacterium]